MFYCQDRRAKTRFTSRTNVRILQRLLSCCEEQDGSMRVAPPPGFPHNATSSPLSEGMWSACDIISGVFGPEEPLQGSKNLPENNRSSQKTENHETSSCSRCSAVSADFQPVLQVPLDHVTPQNPAVLSRASTGRRCHQEDLQRPNRDTQRAGYIRTQPTGKVSAAVPQLGRKASWPGLSAESRQDGLISLGSYFRCPSGI